MSVRIGEPRLAWAPLSYILAARSATAPIPPLLMDSALPRRIAELRVAGSFLTRLPFGGGSAPLAEAAWAFPLVGLVVGAVGAGTALLAAAAGLPGLAVGLLAVGAMALATGALHEDGLADTADALGAGGGRERMLAIMRDSRIGSYGALALILGVGLRAALVGALLADAWTGALLPVAAAVWSRALLPLAMARLPRARSDGLAVAAGACRLGTARASLALGLLLVLACGAVGGLPAALLGAGVAGLVAAALARVAARRLGGYTGDVLGALQQVAEIAFLIGAVALS
jgi:adenosylcobinamide-GDP ribazoletransferase